MDRITLLRLRGQVEMGCDAAYISHVIVVDLNHPIQFIGRSSLYGVRY